MRMHNFAALVFLLLARQCPQAVSARAAYVGLVLATKEHNKRIAKAILNLDFPYATTKKETCAVSFFPFVFRPADYFVKPNETNVRIGSSPVCQ